MSELSVVYGAAELQTNQKGHADTCTHQHRNNGPMEESG